MIKALVNTDNNGIPGVELAFKGTTVDVLYEYSLLTLSLLSRLTLQVDDPEEHDKEMLRMLDGLGGAVAMLIADGAYKDACCKVVESESVVIDHDTIRKMCNRGGDE